MSYGTTELPYTAARIKGIIKATGQITVKPAGLAGIQLDCNGATGDFTASITPANLTGNRRWILPNRDDTFAGLGAQTFTGAQKISVADTVVAARFSAATATMRFRPYVDATNGAIFECTDAAEAAYLPFTLLGNSVRLFGNGGTGLIIGAAGDVSISSSTASTSTTTGALVVTGGVGVGGAINAATIKTAGTAWVLTASGVAPTFRLERTSVALWDSAINAAGGYEIIQTTARLTISISGVVQCSSALEVNSATLIKSNTTLTDGAAAAVGTLTNAPTAGNPTKWVLINDNGTIRKFPTWT